MVSLTNNNRESMNHRFKLATDWKPQHLPELINTIHGIVKVHFADLQRALYGMGNFQFSGGASDQVFLQVYPQRV
jgi:hypothetical protein